MDSWNNEQNHKESDVSVSGQFSGNPYQDQNVYGSGQNAGNGYGQPNTSGGYGQPQNTADSYGQAQNTADAYAQAESGYGSSPQSGGNGYSQPQGAAGGFGQPGNSYGQFQNNAGAANGYGQAQNNYAYGQPYANYNQQPYRGPGFTPTEMEEPIGVGEWAGLLALGTFVPCIGVILILVWAFGNTEKKSKANFCKAFLIIWLIKLAVTAILFIIWGASFTAMVSEF